MGRVLAAALLSLASLSRAAAQDDPNLHFIPADDAAMASAVVEARKTLPAFLERSRHPGKDEDAFAVKVGLGPAGREEFFWLLPFTVKDGIVTGAINNEPEVIRGYRKGQVITKPLAEVTDWMYVVHDRDQDRMRGNYSSCVLMARDGRAALADYEKSFGMDCSRPGG